MLEIYIKSRYSSFFISYFVLVTLGSYICTAPACSVCHFFIDRLGDGHKITAGPGAERVEDGWPCQSDPADPILYLFAPLGLGLGVRSLGGVRSISSVFHPSFLFYIFGAPLLVRSLADLNSLQPSELMDGLEMKPSVLAASLGKRLVVRASRMRRAGIEPKFSRDFRAVAQLTEPKFRVSGLSFLFVCMYVLCCFLFSFCVLFVFCCK